VTKYARILIGRKRIVIAAIVSCVVLVLVAAKAGVRLDRIEKELRSANYLLLLAAIAYSLFWHIIVGTDKWWRILRVLGARIGYFEVMRVRMGSDPIRFATPFKVGEVVNAVYFNRPNDIGFSRAAGSIAFDKALNFIGTLFWLYVGMASLVTVPGGSRSTELILHSLFGLGLAALLVARPVRRLLCAIAERIHSKIGRLARGVLAAFEEFSPLTKIGFLLYGIVFQLRPLIVCYVLLAALGAQRLPPLQELLAFGSVVVLMSNVPLTVAGLGPREAALMALFSAYGSPDMLLTVGVLMSISIHVGPALIGVPFMFPLLRAIATTNLPASMSAAQTPNAGIAAAEDPVTQPTGSRADGSP
jgi:uncharacterized protein (TIRG00374 family)